MKTLLLTFALFSTLALAQTALDPTQSGAYPKYPAYLDHSCGGIAQTQYDERANADGTVTGAFKFLTKCSTGGRGSVPKYFESCWFVDFAADRYTVLVRDEVLYATWRQGAASFACPAI